MTAPKCAGCGELVVSRPALVYGAITGVYRCGGGYCEKNKAFIHQGVYRAPDSALERTAAEKFATEKLAECLTDDGPYRTGVLLLSYASELADKDCRIAGGFAMATVNLESAVDLIHMMKRLRGLADEIEALVNGRRPLPLQGGGNG